MCHKLLKISWYFKDFMMSCSQSFEVQENLRETLPKHLTSFTVLNNEHEVLINISVFEPQTHLKGLLSSDHTVKVKYNVFTVMPIGHKIRGRVSRIFAVFDYFFVFFCLFFRMLMQKIWLLHAVGFLPAEVIACSSRNSWCRDSVRLLIPSTEKNVPLTLRLWLKGRL